MVSRMTDAELAFRAGELFNKKITAAFWDSFKGEYGHTQVEVLVYLHDHGEAKAAELCVAIGVPKQHISKIVKGFLEDELLENHPSPDDRRVGILSLSTKGKELLRKHYQISDDHFDALMKKLPPAAVELLRLSMQQMVEILTEV